MDPCCFTGTAGGEAVTATAAVAALGTSSAMGVAVAVVVTVDTADTALLADSNSVGVNNIILGSLAADGGCDAIKVGGVLYDTVEGVSTTADGACTGGITTERDERDVEAEAEAEAEAETGVDEDVMTSGASK